MPASLLIIIVPMVVLQSVVAFVFMERHWNLVTNYLSAAVTQEIATLIDVYKTYPQDRRSRATAPHRAGPARPCGRFPARRATAAARAEAVLLAARRGAVGGDPQADRPAVLDRHRRPLVDRGNPHQARRHGHARLRASAPMFTPRIRWIFLVWMVVTSLVVLAVAIAVPAQPDPPDRAARRRRRSFRQRPRGAEFPPARRARSAPRRGRVSRNEGPRRARHRAAHHDARRRLARSAHDPHPLQARTRADRRDAGNRRHEEGRRRDGGNARGLSRLRARRHGRAVGADRHGRVAGRAQARRPSATAVAQASASTASRK